MVFIFDIAVPDRNPNMPPVARRQMSLDEEIDHSLDSTFDRKEVVSNNGRA